MNEGPEGQPAEPRGSALLFAQFRETARRAALFELGVRLLADETAVLSSCALEEKLALVVEKVVAHFGAELSEEERVLLPWCSVTRDELFGADAVPSGDPDIAGFREVSLRFSQAIRVIGRLQTD